MGAVCLKCDRKKRITLRNNNKSYNKKLLNGTQQRLTLKRYIFCIWKHSSGLIIRPLPWGSSSSPSVWLRSGTTAGTQISDLNSMHVVLYHTAFNYFNAVLSQLCTPCPLSLSTNYVTHWFSQFALLLFF